MKNRFGMKSRFMGEITHAALTASLFVILKYGIGWILAIFQ